MPKVTRVAGQQLSSCTTSALTIVNQDNQQSYTSQAVRDLPQSLEGADIWEGFELATYGCHFLRQYSHYVVL